MTSYLFMKSLRMQRPSAYIELLVMSVAMLSMVACSSIQPTDYSVKDSLYVWSEAFDEAEAMKVVTDYQSISSLEQSLLNDTENNSDVESVYEEMLDHEIAEIDSSLEKINRALDALQKQAQTTDSGSAISIEANTDAQSNTDQVATNLQKKQVQNEVVKQVVIESVDDINRITVETPTAAGTPVQQVLPEIKTEVSGLKASDEIVQLAKKSNYQFGNNEYGMWQLVKSNDSMYQEVCSLSSSTMQVELENYATQVWFRVVGNGLLVNSTTNIDVYKPGIGIKFDNGSFQAFDKSYFNTSAVWSGDLGRALNNNKQFRINIGGNELGTRTHRLAIDLKDLKQAYSEYQKCNSGTQVGRL